MLSSTEFILAGACGVVALAGMAMLLLPHVRKHGTYTVQKGVYVLFTLMLLAVMYFFYPLIHSTLYGTYQALAERINECCSVGPKWDSLGYQSGYAFGETIFEKTGFLGIVLMPMLAVLSFIGLLLWTIVWLAILIVHTSIMLGFTYHVLPAALVVLLARWPGYPLLVYGLLGGYFLCKGTSRAAFQTAVAVSRHPVERALGSDRRRWHTTPARTLKKGLTDIRRDPVPPAWRSRVYKERVDRLTDLLGSEERFLHSFRRYKKRRMGMDD
jgi:hypothetical protein